MAKIKIAEIFHSLQGEGLYTGVPSVFVRTFGCNFRCRGFGLPEDDYGDQTLSTEADEIAEQLKFHPEWNQYDKLPLTKTGCDSYASWHPKFKSYSKMMETSDIVTEMEVARMKNEPFHPICGGQTHLVITGGEPLLGWQKHYPEFLTKAAETGYKHVTFETNGTQKIVKEFEDFLLLNHIGGPNMNFTFSVSPKLPSSGEDIKDALQPEVVASYMRFGTVYLKFVVAGRKDIDFVHAFVNRYRDAGFTGEVYLMPCGGDRTMYDLNAPEVAKLAMSGGYRYSPRLQVDLWSNEWGT